MTDIRTKRHIYQAVAKSLREFGYTDITPDMIRETYDAMKRGDEEMPHGVIGMFAKSQLDEVWDALEKLP